MAVGLPKAIITAAGRKLYQDAKGKFISKSRFDLLNRMDPATGKFISKAAAARRGSLQSQEAKLRRQLGRPPRGYNWVRIANKYPDRFAAFI